jgi:type II secretory pathway pseudopilin PulG
MPIFLARYWSHLCVIALIGVVSALGSYALQMTKSNAVLVSDMRNEEACREPSHCRQKVTEFERNTERAARVALEEAARKVGEATAALEARKAEIEIDSENDRAAVRAKLREAQAKLEEAMSNDPQCKAWLDSPVPCPVPDARSVLFAEGKRSGLIDRSGLSADPALPAGAVETHQPEVPADRVPEVGRRP